MKRTRTASTTVPSSLPPGKYSSLSPSPPPSTSNDDCSPRHARLVCSLPPHAPLSLPDAAAYEVHMRAQHSNICITCHKNFPSAHYLSLHLAESHDPFLALRRERGDKVYACFVEGCDKRCSRPATRRMHLVDRHGFPRNYDVYVVKDGLGARKSLLRDERRRGGWRGGKSGRGGGDSGRSRVDTQQGMGGEKEPEEQMDESAEERSDDDDDDDDEEEMASAEPRASAASKRKADNQVSPSPDLVSSSRTPRTVGPDVDMDALTRNMSSLRFVPNSVRFGRGKKGGRLAKG